MTEIALLLALVPAIGGKPGGEPTYQYTGEYARVAYRYRTDSGAPGGDVVGFDLETTFGPITGRLERLASYTRLVLSHAGSETALAVDRKPALAAGSDDVQLSIAIGEEDFYFKALADKGTVELVADRSPDCATLRSAALVRAITEGSGALRTELESHPRPPQHLAEVAATVITADALLQLGGCPDESGADAVRAAGCYYDTTGFVQCVDCCDNDSQAVGVICQGGVLFGCQSRSCNKLGKLACGAFTAMARNVCVRHNCNGKPGNPGCPSPKPPCPGACLHFCGPGWSSTCGECPEGMDCCS